ncbi:hypothetical protein CO709_07895 [Burkholderia thailandensis]|uniref:thioesterase II family protein n=1 Tax=Burkholderia humptydooensis TaxID=430531 RepID=UPI0009E2886F|nr:hypothetical protein CO709_07895 [Burkholderia thailandensis]
MTKARCVYTVSRHTDRAVRLVCFPHAGAGASIYYAWEPLVPPDVGVHAAQLAGREQRRDEPPRIDWVPLVRKFAMRSTAGMTNRSRSMDTASAA